MIELCFVSPETETSIRNEARQFLNIGVHVTEQTPNFDFVLTNSAIAE